MVADRADGHLGLTGARHPAPERRAALRLRPPPAPAGLPRRAQRRRQRHVGRRAREGPARRRRGVGGLPVQRAARGRHHLHRVRAGQARPGGARRPCGRAARRGRRTSSPPPRGSCPASRATSGPSTWPPGRSRTSPGAATRKRTSGRSAGSRRGVGCGPSRRAPRPRPAAAPAARAARRAPGFGGRATSPAPAAPGRGWPGRAGRPPAARRPAPPGRRRSGPASRCRSASPPPVPTRRCASSGSR